MSLSPMMQQYHDAKAACGDALLLFRMGDFYEVFYEDAKTCAKALGLTLTSRDKGERAVAMAGFPHHQLESYLGKLVRQGFRVAVCDQVEDPKQAKGIVKREVTRVVTAGTLTDDGLLDPHENNYLAAMVSGGGETVGLAWVELSTGRFYAGSFPAARLVDELARIGPSELLSGEEDHALPPVEHLVQNGRPVITRRPPWAFDAEGAQKLLGKQFGTATLEGLGFGEGDTTAIRAAGAVLEYLEETQKSSLDHIDRLVPYGTSQRLEIDESTRRSLELTRTLREGRREGSLLAVIDETVTAMGSRQLADWLANPLAEGAAIEARHEAVAELVGESSLAEDLRHELDQVYDLERLLARVTTGRASPRDLQFIGRTLARLPSVKAKLTCRKSAALNELEESLDLCGDLRAALEKALADECPLTTADGGFIRAGYNSELDGLRELAAGGKQWIAQYQADEVERSGIPSMKVGYNKVFGYYIEITNVHRERVPEHYIRKQTLKNAERYITPELKEYEEKVVTADDKARELETRLFVELRESVRGEARRLQQTAAVLAQLDVLAALAQLARKRNYCRPEMVSEPVLEIEDGRHPVLEAIEAPGSFVPNDTAAGGDAGTLLLITGPNMAGKSTYIRQVALISILAQMGSFVPAKRARLGVADRVFARVGASDELSRGQSTFMVEMIETARILNTATPKSLVILDEIGRGTSTYDGLSLAWAVVEHLHDTIGCRTLFATHYHELTDLARTLPGVVNLNVAVKEWQEDVVFLHKIVPGAADKSYGIHVARLAGVPREVNERAKEILWHLEEEHLDGEGRPRIARRDENHRPSGPVQLSLFTPMEHPLLDEIRRLDLDDISPRDALRLVEEWQGQLTEHVKKKAK